MKSTLISTSRHLNEDVNHTVAQWTSVLDLAHMWGFDQVRAVAIKHLSQQPLTPFRKVALSLKYDITEWYEDAYFNLARRSKPLEVEEAKLLGRDVAIKIARVSEQYFALCKCNAGRCQLRNSALDDNDHELQRIVRKTFGLF